MSLDSTAVRAYHETGLLGPFPVLDPSSMAEVRYDIENRIFKDASPPSGWFANARHLDERPIFDLLSHPALVERLKALYGPDLVLWNSAFWIKRPGDPRVPWHQDLHYWPMDPPLNFSVWLAITEATVDNGALFVLPGSHLEVLPVVEAGEDDLFAKMTDPATFDAGKARPLVMRPGEAIIFSDRLLHRSGLNNTTDDRIGLVGRYTLPVVQLFQDRVPLFPAHRSIMVAGKDRFQKNRSGPPPEKN